MARLPTAVFDATRSRSPSPNSAQGSANAGGPVSLRARRCLSRSGRAVGGQPRSPGHCFGRREVVGRAGRVPPLDRQSTCTHRCSEGRRCPCTAERTAVPSHRPSSKTSQGVDSRVPPCKSPEAPQDAGIEHRGTERPTTVEENRILETQWLPRRPPGPRVGMRFDTPPDPQPISLANSSPLSMY